jgi:hypothetical protein
VGKQLGRQIAARAALQEVEIVGQLTILHVVVIGGRRIQTRTTAPSVRLGIWAVVLFRMVGAGALPSAIRG